MESPSIILPKKSEGMESIKVLVRVRPLSVTELAEKNDSVVDIISDQSLNVTSADGKKSFKCSFDSVLGPESTQNEVYDIIRGCTESVIDGFNSTIFAYGQTGSGKVGNLFVLVLLIYIYTVFIYLMCAICLFVCIEKCRPTLCTVHPVHNLIPILQLGQNIPHEDPNIWV